MSSLWFWGRERKSHMIGCPFCFPPVLLLWVTHSFYWCKTNVVATASGFPPAQLQYNLNPCLCFNSPSLIPSLSLSPLHLLSPPSILRLCSNSLRRLVLFCLPISFFFPDLLLVSRRLTSPKLGWPIFQRAVQWRQLDLCLQSAVGPQFLGQWDMLRKKSLPSFFPLVLNSHMSKAHEDNLKPFSQAEEKCSDILKQICYDRIVHF